MARQHTEATRKVGGTRSMHARVARRWKLSLAARADIQGTWGSYHGTD
jgi:hypothetical protein